MDHVSPREFRFMTATLFGLVLLWCLVLWLAPVRWLKPLAPLYQMGVREHYQRVEAGQ